MTIDIQSCARTGHGGIPHLFGSTAATMVTTALLSVGAYSARAQQGCSIVDDTATCDQTSSKFPEGLYFMKDSGIAEVVLKDGVSIETTNRAGIVLRREGHITIGPSEAEGTFSVATSGDRGDEGVVPATYGIFARVDSSEGSVDITVPDVTATGPKADGVHVRVKGGNISLSSSGLINVSGEAARGVYVGNEAERNEDGESIVGEVRISVHDVYSNADHSVYGMGSAVRAHASGNVFVESSGRIQTTTNENASVSVGSKPFRGLENPIAIGVNEVWTTGNNAIGVLAYGTDGVTVGVSGEIDTLGDGSKGIYAFTSGGSSSISIEVADITTRGSGAHAIEAFAPGKPTDEGGPSDIAISAAGRIDTEGENAHGIFARGQGAVTVNIGNAGEIRTGAAGANALRITGEGTESLLPSSVTILNEGLITGDTLVRSAGNVELTSSGEVAGVFDLDAPNGIQFTNSGTLEGGLLASSSQAINIRNAGELTGRAVLDTEGDLSFQNCLSVCSTTGDVPSEPVSTASADARTSQFEGEIEIRNAPESHIFNSGLFEGSVRVESPSDSRVRFNNEGTVIGSGDFNLGSGGHFLNSGRFLPSARGEIANTRIIGGFDQPAGGIMGIDVDWKKESADLVSISGQAGLRGTLEVNALSRPRIGVGAVNEVQFFRADGGISGEVDLEPVDTLLVDYSIRKDSGPDGDGEQLALLASVEFDPAALDGELDLDQEGVFEAMMLTEAEESPVLTEMIQLLAIDELTTVLDGVGAGSLPALLHTELPSAIRFQGRIGDCNSEGTDGFRESILGSANSCNSLFADRQRFDRSGISGGLAFGEDSRALSLAFSMGSAEPGSRLGLGISVENADVNMAPHATATGQRYHFGASYHEEVGPFDMAAGASIGTGQFEVSRTLPTSAPDGYARGNFGTGYTSLHTRVSLPRTFEGITVEPSLDASVLRLATNPYGETGGGIYRLSASAFDVTATALRPAIAVSGTVDTDGWSIRPRLGLGLTRTVSEDTELPATFESGQTLTPRLGLSSDTRDVEFGLVFQR